MLSSPRHVMLGKSNCQVVQDAFGGGSCIERSSKFEGLSGYCTAADIHTLLHLHQILVQTFSLADRM